MIVQENPAASLPLSITFPSFYLASGSDSDCPAVTQTYSSGSWPSNFVVNLQANADNEISVNSINTGTDVGTFSLELVATLGTMTRSMDLTIEVIDCFYDFEYDSSTFVASPDVVDSHALSAPYTINSPAFKLASGISSHCGTVT